jgi:hypothetical protein
MPKILPPENTESIPEIESTEPEGIPESSLIVPMPPVKLAKSESDAIAIGLVLGYLYRIKNPSTLSLESVAKKLRLEPDQVGAALMALQQQGRIKLAIASAVVQLED